MMKLSDLFQEPARINVKQDSFFIKPEGKNPFSVSGKKRVNLLALGDVGSMLLIGLRLMGSDVIESIGICDLDPKVTARYEMEINQIEQPLDHGHMPKVHIVQQEQLFECDMMIFCASKGVPPVGGDVKDVRMAQMEANSQLVGMFAEQAVSRGFGGVFAVVSDPVDPLCKAAYLAGLGRDQVQGFGLGVMNSRALYFAGKDEKFESFPREGRAFGPHGQDLVIANSLEHYDDALSRELTQLTIESNMKTRQLGFKPFIAPALSSGAIAILANLSGSWHYSSVYFGKEKQGAFLGVRNRRTPYGLEVEDQPLPESLYQRIKNAYDNLTDLI